MAWPYPACPRQGTGLLPWIRTPQPRGSPHPGGRGASERPTGGPTGPVASRMSWPRAHLPGAAAPCGLTHPNFFLLQGQGSQLLIKVLAWLPDAPLER